LVSRVVPVELYLDEAKRLAREIASQPPIAVRMAKEAVLQAYESTLGGGLEFERRCFHLLFGTEDKREGVRAFLEKRPAQFTGRWRVAARWRGCRSTPSRGGRAPACARTASASPPPASPSSPDGRIGGSPCRVSGTRGRRSWSSAWP